MSNPTIPEISLTSKNCPDPLYWGIPISFKERFHPLGTTIQVESNDPSILEEATRSFGRYGPPPPFSKPRIVLQLCVDPEFHDAGSWPVPQYRSLQHLFHIHCGEANFAIADLSLEKAIGFVSQEMARSGSFFRRTFLECLFHVLVVRLSHTPIHCSCVALNNNGILICGVSGAGKTTLAYACAKSGMQVVSDDVVHLQPDWVGDTITLWGNPWELRLLPEASKLFPGMAAGVAPHQTHLEINITKDFPGADRVSCRPYAIVFLERCSGEKVECVPLKPEVALERLKKDIVLDEEKVLERHYSTLSRLVRIGAYSLIYSGHPSLAVTALRRLLPGDTGVNSLYDSLI